MRKILIPILLVAFVACKKELPVLPGELVKEPQKEQVNNPAESSKETDGEQAQQEGQADNKAESPKEEKEELPQQTEHNTEKESEDAHKKPTDLAALEKFYATKFTVNQRYIQQHFMQGVYENASAFLGNILEFDENRYRPGNVVSKNVDMRRNSFTLTFKVYDVEDNTEYVEVTKTFSGFKTVDVLVKDLKISPRYELLEVVRQTLSKKKSHADLTKALEGNFVNKNWMHLMDYTYKGELLELQEIQQPYQRNQVIRGTGDELDVYLQNPRWKLKSASLKENDLHLTVQLEMVNQIVLSDVSFNFVLKNIIK